MASKQTRPAGRPEAGFRSSSATAIGILAVGLWAALAPLTALCSGLPPFELLSLSFSVAFALSIVLLALRGRRAFSAWRQPVSAWRFSFSAIFTYHALYFFAMRHAPTAEASLIAYLWPLLIVLISTLVDRSAFRQKHLIGACLGFLGTAVVILGPGKTADSSGLPMTGYLAAAGCAIVWSTYSVMNRRFRAIPSEMIGGVCGLVALAGLFVHVLFEQFVWPTPSQVLLIILLGVGPVGLAFFAWDHATKYGSLPLIGALAYLTPLLSTLLLMALGLTPMGWSIVAAALLIVLGAAAASFGLPRRPKRDIQSEKA